VVVVRLALLVVASSACDVVLQLETVDPNPARVGRTLAVAQTFTGFNGTVTDFALAGDGARAIVPERVRRPADRDTHGRRRLGGRPGAVDGARQPAHRRSSDDVARGLVLSAGTPLAIGATIFVAGAWSLTTNGVDMVVAGYPLVDVVIGNEVELGVQPDNITSFAVVRLADADAKYQLRLRVKVPGVNPHWTDDLEMEQINAVGNPEHGVVTADADTLVYASARTGDASVDLFVSQSHEYGPSVSARRAARRESTPAPTRVEPWIDAACARCTSAAARRQSERRRHDLRRAGPVR